MIMEFSESTTGSLYANKSITAEWPSPRRTTGGWVEQLMTARRDSGREIKALAPGQHAHRLNRCPRPS